jgi:Uri superfamily endonuclease
VKGAAPLFVRFAAAAPNEAGAYALLISLPSPLAVKAGARTASLAPGLYLYCGSARGPGGLAARIARHMRREKRAHWHVDQLTRDGEVFGAFVFPGGDECAINATLDRLPTPLEGFGSSDCRRCRSHLRYWPKGVQLPHAFEAALPAPLQSLMIHLSPNRYYSRLEPGQLVYDNVPNNSV